MGVYNTLRAAGPHISHPRGYALPVASLAAAVHAPLLGAYSASKAAVEALGNTLRVELRASGAKVGVAYFAELDTDMTRRGFGTEAAGKMKLAAARVAPLEVGIDSLERGIARRSRRVYAPRWVGPVLPVRMAVQPLVDRVRPDGPGAGAGDRAERGRPADHQPAGGGVLTQPRIAPGRPAPGRRARVGVRGAGGPRDGHPPAAPVPDAGAPPIRCSGAGCCSPAG